MRIGILTYHRSHNYGALLQAYALKEYISSLEKDVCFIDYWPHYHQEMYALWKPSQFRKASIMGKIRMLLISLLFSWKRKRRMVLFERFIAKYILPLASVDDRFDLVVYGSDQIWRYQDHASYKGYNPVYFGDKTITSKSKISYAASMGVIKLSEKDRSQLSDWLLNLDMISVREEDLRDAIRPLTSKDIRLVVDPVFLLPQDSWKSIMSPRQRKGRYILSYNLQLNSLTRQVAKMVGEKMRLPIVEIKGGIYLFDSDGKRSMVGPCEFLSWIYYSDCVVSSSFHGIAFSVLFEKHFYATLERNAGRVRSLLSRIGLESRIVSDCDAFTMKDFSYEGRGRLLADCIADSKHYLDTCVGLI